jgi:hypothetical protein
MASKRRPGCLSWRQAMCEPSEGSIEMDNPDGPYNDVSYCEGLVMLDHFLERYRANTSQ